MLETVCWSYRGGGPRVPTVGVTRASAECEFEESSVAAETAAEPAADGEGPGPKQKAADLAIEAVKRIMSWIPRSARCPPRP